MTIVWLIYGIIDSFRPLQKRKLLGLGDEYMVLFFFCIAVDCVILGLLEYFLKW